MSDKKTLTTLIHHMRNLIGLSTQAVDLLQKMSDDAQRQLLDVPAETTPLDAAQMLLRIVRDMQATGQQMEDFVKASQSFITQDGTRLVKTPDGATIVAPVNALGLDPEEAGN